MNFSLTIKSLKAIFEAFSAFVRASYIPLLCSLFLVLFEVFAAGVLLNLAVLAHLYIGGVLALKWHRLVLKGEGAAQASPETREILHYVLMAFVLGLIWILPTVTTFIVMMLWDDPVDMITGEFTLFNPWTVSAWVAAVAMAFFIFIALRLSMVLPHIALHGRSFGWSKSWRGTQDAFAPILTAAILSAAAIVVTSWVQDIYWGIDIYTEQADIVLGLKAFFVFFLDFFFYLLTVLFTVSLISQIYKDAMATRAP